MLFINFSNLYVSLMVHNLCWERVFFYGPLTETVTLLAADAEYTYEEMEREMKCKLMALADEACSHMHDQR